MTSGWLSSLKLQPVDISSLPVEGQARLMDMVYNRVRTSMAVMSIVFLPFLWAASQRQSIAALQLWMGFYLVFMLAVWVPYLLYRRDSIRLDAQARLTIWSPRIDALALVHGAGLSLSVLLAIELSDVAYLALLAIALGHIASVSSRVAGRSSLSGHALQYLAIGINPATLLIPWVFPDQWFFILPLWVLYAVVIYRTTQNMFKAMIRQIQLEQDSQQMATLYKAAKEQAEDTLQEKNLFLTTASHDLRQPMHAMSMLVEAIAQRNRDPAVAPLLADLKNGMGSMNMMFNSLLDLSKLESGAVAQRATRVSLHPMVKDIVTMFREQANQRGLTLRMHAPRGNATVWADPALLRQALVNLVHNALRYTERGGILIGLRVRGTTWQIEVWDTGVGIAAEDGQQIFSRHYRSQHAWRLHSAGHGLGLAVVARCAHLMDAALGFQSRLGKGSRFWLGVPAAQQAEFEERPPSDDANGVPPLRQLSGYCLVLDDDPQVIAGWKALLGAWGVTTRYAADARQAMQLLDAGFTPDAIFCDQRLRSGESGFEVLKALLNRYPQACGAMVSGEFHSTELQNAENDGYLVLRKPLEPSQLHAVMSNWLPRGAVLRQ